VKILVVANFAFLRATFRRSLLQGFMAEDWQSGVFHAAAAETHRAGRRKAFRTPCSAFAHSPLAVGNRARLHAQASHLWPTMDGVLVRTSVLAWRVETQHHRRRRNITPPLAVMLVDL